MNETHEITFALDSAGVALLTFNRPDKLNALTSTMIEEWLSLTQECAANDAVRAIVITGAGRAFCVGGDANAMQSRTELNALERKDFLWRGLHRIALTLEQLDKPVLAAINGTARGAGMDAALMCDLRVMGAGATLAESYINMGIIAGSGGTYYLPRLVGVCRALHLCWTGKTITAEEAERIGLINMVVPDADVVQETIELAQQIAKQPYEAVRAYKRSIYQGMSMPLSTHLDMVSSHMAVLRDTPDHRERVEAFIARAEKSKREK